MRIAILFAFFASILFLPWFVTVALGVVLIAWYQAYLSVLIGGVLLDSMFGAPIAALGSFSFIYTALFACLSAVSYVLRRRVME